MEQEPKYRQVAVDLRASIRQGAYQPGNLIPKETELMRRFGASRTTVRRAITELRREGLVLPIRRRGTVVRRPPVRITLARYSRVLKPGSASGPWQTACADQGVAGKVEVVAVERRHAGAYIAGCLELDEGSEVIYRRRHMWAEEDVAQVQEVWMSAALVEDTALAEPARVVGGAYQAWVSIGRPPASVSETIASRMPTAEEASLMRLGSSIPVLTIERITRDGEGRVLELLHVSAAADRSELHYDNLPIGPSSS